MDESKLISMETVKMLKDLQAKSKRKLFDNLVTIFSQSIIESIEKMNIAIGGKNYEELSNIAHSMKSCCGNVGASYLQEQFSKIDEQAMSEGIKDLEIIKTCFGQIKESYERTNELLVGQIDK